MKLKIYKNPLSFWEETSSFLIKNAAVNNLLLGLSKSFIQNSDQLVYQGAVFEEAKLVAVMIANVHMGSCKVIVSNTESTEAVDLLSSSFLALNVNPVDIIGHKETACLYAAKFKEVGFEFEVRMPQGVYKCSKVKVPNINEGLSFELASLKHLKIVSEWMKSFLIDVSLEDEIPKNMLTAAEKAIENQLFYILIKNGKLCSLAGWGRDIGETCVVNFVYTPNEYRGRGYGSLVSALLTQKLLDEGKKEVHLYTDLKNLTSNKIYQAIGYEFVCESVNMRICS